MEKKLVVFSTFLGFGLIIWIIPYQVQIQSCSTTPS